MKNEKQPPLTGLKMMCGLGNCKMDAVCGLKSKDGKLHFNVCAECYKKVTGKEFNYNMLRSDKE